MNATEKRKNASNLPDFFNSGNIILPSVSLLALAATFFASISKLNFETKIGVFAAIIFFYLLFCVIFYFRQKSNGKISTSGQEIESPDSVFTPEIERQLLALEEASRFFGSSLKPADMFRLVGSRINEMIPFASAALFRVEEETQTLKAIGAVGENSRELVNLEINSMKGLAGKSTVSRRIQTDEKLLLEKSVIPSDALKNLESAIAVPLFRNQKTVFSVLVLYGDRTRKFDKNAPLLLEAVAERIAPLFVSSLAFEQSLSNALTDSLTNLPNERAFYLILENQIAESQRQREQRPLTILTVDIKGFDALNQKFGHSTGDRILYFAADNIKAQLRKMDFISRASGDEFLIVLPTASDAIAEEIINRIEIAFKSGAFEIDAKEKIYLELNFGAATFLKDGETAPQLLQKARLEKQQAKPGASSKIIKFPKEFVN